MAENKLLTREERNEIMTATVEAAVSALHNSMVYCGVTKRHIVSHVEAPDGTKYRLTIEVVDEFPVKA